MSKIAEDRVIHRLKALQGFFLWFLLNLNCVEAKRGEEEVGDLSFGIEKYDENSRTGTWRVLLRLFILSKDVWRESGPTVHENFSKFITFHVATGAHRAFICKVLSYRWEGLNKRGEQEKVPKLSYPRKQLNPPFVGGSNQQNVVCWFDPPANNIFSTSRSSSWIQNNICIWAYLDYSLLNMKETSHSCSYFNVICICKDMMSNLQIFLSNLIS